MVSNTTLCDQAMVCAISQFPSSRYRIIGRYVFLPRLRLARKADARTKRTGDENTLVSRSGAAGVEERGRGYCILVT